MTLFGTIINFFNNQNINTNYAFLMVIFLSIFEIGSYYPIIFELLMWTLIAIVILKLGNFYAHGYGMYISNTIGGDSDSDSDNTE